MCSNVRKPEFYNNEDHLNFLHGYYELNAFHGKWEIG